MDINLQVDTGSGGYGINYSSIDSFIKDLDDDIYISYLTTRKIKKWIKNKNKRSTIFTYDNVRVEID